MFLDILYSKNDLPILYLKPKLWYLTDLKAIAAWQHGKLGHFLEVVNKGSWPPKSL